MFQISLDSALIAVDKLTLSLVLVWDSVCYLKWVKAVENVRFQTQEACLWRARTMGVRIGQNSGAPSLVPGPTVSAFPENSLKMLSLRPLPNY